MPSAGDVRRGLHGGVTDNPALKGLLDFGNWLRYGQSEAGRQEDVQGLRTPGVEDVAYPMVPGTSRGPQGEFLESEVPTFDPAAAERYTSAYQFGQRFQPPEWAQPALHAISSGGRRSMHAVPFVRDLFGVGEEREELEEAERLGMERGARGQEYGRTGMTTGRSAAQALAASAASKPWLVPMQ